MESSAPGSRLDADHPENGVLIPCRFTLSRINDHNIQKLDALLPWNWKTAAAKLAA